MKFTKYLFLTLCSISLCTAAMAQSAGVYTLIAGGTANLPAVSTNIVYPTLTTSNLYGLPGTASNLVQSVAQFDYAGVTLQYVGTIDTTNVAVGVLVYGSANNGVAWDSTPRWALTNITLAASATTGYTSTTVTNLDTHGLTSLAFVPYNRTAVGIATNFLLQVNLKSPKVYQLPARN